ncbi:hypothetical protein GUJ93_ZPchr0010g7634 [Zizania palustris]|uniref:Uncharacterized protein n=1 Tax=Zizania palustris TaxID=103762 RepID=A0A8J5WBR1_ZIZPA|nr:hypothetical protein GUJ93_ZPchr0010g7634 [Zizania palustris]
MGSTAAPMGTKGRAGGEFVAVPVGSWWLRRWRRLTEAAPRESDWEWSRGAPMGSTTALMGTKGRAGGELVAAMVAAPNRSSAQGSRSGGEQGAPMGSTAAPMGTKGRTGGEFVATPVGSWWLQRWRRLPEAAPREDDREGSRGAPMGSTAAPMGTKGHAGGEFVAPPVGSWWVRWWRRQTEGGKPIRSQRRRCGGRPGPSQD